MEDSIKGTVENLMFKDYCDENVFKSFQELNEAPFIKNFKYYTLFELYKNCQGKIILDIPSSYGYIALKFLELGAEHVICSDIVSEQLEYGKSIFNGKGYDSSKCSFIQHDGKIPKVIGPFADLVISFHLFCFADNEEEIENMAEMLFLNLKPKGEAVISFCPIYNEEKFHLFEKLQNVKVIKYVCEPDKWPGCIHTNFSGFNIVSNIWPERIVIEAMKKVGFINIRFQEFMQDPEYTGNDLHLHNEYAKYNLIIANKP